MSKNSSGHTASERDDVFIIGNEVGFVGRWFRLFLGLWGLVHFFLRPIILNPVEQASDWYFYYEVGGWFVFLVVVYAIVYRILGGYVFSRFNPWAGTAVFLGIPTLLSMFQLVPHEFQTAFGTYVSFSLLFAFYLRYGGCEVVALPILFTGQRYTMYCPLNAVDSIERAMYPRGKIGSIMMIISMGITIFVGGSFILLVAYHLLGYYGIGYRPDPRWAWLLLIPAAHTGYLAVSALKAGNGLLSPDVRKYGLGALVLGAAVLAFTQKSISNYEIWLGVLIAGTAYTVAEIVAKVR